MKRFGDTLRSIAVLACLLCWLPTCGLAAANEEDTGANTAVDLVVLIDDSNSMYETISGKPGNDPEKHRREAAAIMLNMCELGSSRAAVVSFGDRAVNIEPAGLDYSHGLISISGKNIRNRDALIASLMRHNGRYTNTNVAAAIQRAEELFDATPAQAGNQRVVLLITDDEPYVPPTQGSPANRSVENGISLLMQAMANSTVFSADNPQQARIYVVKLLNASLTATDAQDVYKRIAQQTGGKVYTAYQAADLPARFADMMADQIGSRLATLQAKPYQKADGTYGIGIRIPNRSVTEANILVDMQGILKDSVKLYKPLATGQTEAEQAFADNHSVFYNATKSFAQYKIAAIEDNGVWELTYQLDPAAEIAGEAQQPKATVMVLFSYNLSLAADLAVASERNPITAMEKNDTLRLTMRFRDAQGQPSTDLLLYQPVTTVSGQTSGIQVRAYALPKGRKPGNALPATALSLTPTSQGQGQFSLTCKPADLGVTGAGEYQLYVNADGDGLVRDLPEPIDFAVINNPPVFSVQGGITLRINDPAVQGMARQARTTLSPQDLTLCHDSDGAFDKLSLTAASAEESIVWVEDPADGTAGVTLVAARAGQCDVTLIASDGEADGTVRQQLPVTVVDVAQELRARYQPEIVVEAPATEGGVYPIGGTMSLLLTLRDRQGGGPVAIDGYAMSATLAATEADTAPVQVTLTRVDGQNAWRGSLPCGSRTRTLSLSGGVQLGLAENGVSLLTQTPLTVRIGNAAPVPVAQEIDRQRFEYWVEPSWLDARQPDECCVLDLAACFADDDAPADLTYFAAILPQGVPAPVTLAQAQALALTPVAEDAAVLTLAQDGQLTVLPRAKGAYQLVAGVSDGEGQSAVFTRTVAVRSIREAARQRALMIALIAAAAGLLGWLVITLVKPSYRGMVFETYQRGVFQDNKPLPSGKGRQSMMFARPITGGAEGSLVSQALSAIYIKPGVKQSLLLKLRRQPPSGVGIELNNKTLPARKRVRMEKNSMLTLRVRQNGVESVFSWKLTQSRPTYHGQVMRGGTHPAAGGGKQTKKPY